MCRRGDAPDPSKTFSLAHVDNFQHCHGVNPILSTANNNSSSGGGGTQPLHATTAKQKEQQQQHHQQHHHQHLQQHSHHQPLQQLQLSTPHPNITVTSTPCNPNPASSDSALLTPVANNVIDVTPPQATEGNNSSMQIDHPPIDGTPLMAM